MKKQNTKNSLFTSVHLPASTALVWEVLMDFESYGQWNPFVVAISGQAKVGQPLRVDLQLDAGKPMRMQPVVVAVEHKRLFEWQGSLGVKGLFDGRHRFALLPHEDGSCILEHSETFSGWLVPLIWPLIARRTKIGFEKMNEALRNRLATERA